MSENSGRGVGVPSGTDHSRAESEEVSVVPTNVSNAVAKLRENAESLHSWAKSFDKHTRQASDPLFGRGYGIEDRVFDLFEITSRLGASIYQCLLETASAIEALGSTEAETPNPNPETPHVR